MLALFDKASSLPPPALFHPILTPKDELTNNNEYLSTPPPAAPVTAQQPIKTPQPSRDVLAVIQKYISDLEGRDKSIKIIQYAFKILLHYRWVDSKRWSTMVSHFSQTRKILRVGHCLGTIREMMDLYSSSTKNNNHPLRMLATWCGLLITLGNEVADDLFCFYKMGVFGPSLGKKAEKVSIYCWFVGIFIDLKSNLKSLHALLQQKRKDLSVEEQHAHQQKIFLARVSCTKLMMDGIFCGK
jgi:hypothetical protein